MRVINYVFYGALLALATLTLGLIILVRFNVIANPLPPNSSIVNLKSLIPHAYIVQSGSMEPAIKVGSIVIVQRSGSYSPNDVITFKNSPNDKNPTTHRIYHKDYPQGIAAPAEYLTAGDANEEFDRNKVREEQIVGKVVFTLPYAGYIADFAKKPYGFILLVIVPATIIIYEELKFLKAEFGKGLSKFWSRIQQLQQLLPPFKGATFKASRTMVSSINFLPPKTNKPLPRISLILPFLGAFLVITSLSLAYFFDVEQSVGNIFGAAETFTAPTPTPTPTLVDDNPDCEGLGYGFGFKIEPPANGTFSLTDADGELTGEASDDPLNFVTISNFDGTFLDWSATLGIDAVIVKGGPGANLYTYNPEATSDTGLHAPLNTANDKFYGISHIEFCYDYD